MSPRLIVTTIRHLHALSARIAHHPLSKLQARPEARDCPSRGLKPLRWCSGSLAEDGSKALSLNMGGVKGLLSFHQGPGNHQHLGGDLYQEKVWCQISIRDLKDLLDRWDGIGRTSLK